MKRITPKLLFAFSLALFILFLCNPDEVQKTAHESVLFCAAVLIPSLFPGFVLSSLLLDLWQTSARNAKQHLACPPAVLKAWIIGLLAGFPSAADSVCRAVQNGSMSKTEGERCLAFTNNPGIVFVICAVGSGMYGSFSVGAYLWIIQTVTALLVGVLMMKRRPFPNATMPAEGAPDPTDFPKAVVSSVRAVLNICGFVVFFRVLTDVLTPSDSGIFKTVLSGLLEMTCGISQLNPAESIALPLSSLMLGWSGFSVHFQIVNAVSAANLSLRPYFIGKILQAILSALFTIATMPFLYAQPFAPANVFCLTLSAAVAVFTLLARFGKENSHGKRNFRARKATP